MSQFAPDQCGFGDPVGYGAFDMGHYREHLQFIQVLAQRVPAVLIPDHDFSAFLTGGSAKTSAVLAHGQVHVLLGAALGITSVDFSGFNLDDQSNFYDFLGDHAGTHAEIRKQLGII